MWPAGVLPLCSLCVLERLLQLVSHAAFVNGVACALLGLEDEAQCLFCSQKRVRGLRFPSKAGATVSAHQQLMIWKWWECECQLASDANRAGRTPWQLNRFEFGRGLPPSFAGIKQVQGSLFNPLGRVEGQLIGTCWEVERYLKDAEFWGAAGRRESALAARGLVQPGLSGRPERRRDSGRRCCHPGRPGTHTKRSSGCQPPGRQWCGAGLPRRFPHALVYWMDGATRQSMLCVEARVFRVTATP